jgi:cell division protein FtsN
MKPAKSEGAKASAGPQKAAERVAMGASPSENSKPKAEPREPLLPSSIGSPKEGEFTVQVASYPESAEAKARAEDLAKKGFPAYPVEATVKGKTWYRVSIGSFRTAKEASTYRAQLMKQADLRSAIVQRIER